MESKTEEVRERIWDCAKSIAENRKKENNNIFHKKILGVDITEVFSRPRVAEACLSAGLIGSSSMDIRTGWDSTKTFYRAAAMQVIKTEAPKLLIENPPCNKFSNLQTLSLAFRGMEWKEEV